jgi:hypothetical protein
MEAVSTRRERASEKRRKAAVERALVYLREGLAGIDARLGTAEQQIEASARPMATAKALVKDWRRRRPVDAADDRATLARAAYALELGHGWPRRAAPMSPVGG